MALPTDSSFSCFRKLTYITGFGKFYVQERAAREGRNPQTGEKMNIPAQKIPSFSAGNTLKEAV